MDTQDAALLRAFPLFAELPDAVIQALSAMAITREYTAGAIIQLEGDDAEATYIVLRGQVKILRSSPSGREQVIHVATPGQNINLVPVLDNGQLVGLIARCDVLRAIYEAQQRGTAAGSGVATASK